MTLHNVETLLGLSSQLRQYQLFIKYILRKTTSAPEHYNPNVAQTAPKIVLKGERIFEPKDEEVSDEHDGVEEEEDLSDDRVAEDQVNEAERGRQRSIEVDQQVKTLDHTKPKDKKIIAEMNKIKCKDTTQ